MKKDSVNSKMPVFCPSCENQLVVSSLSCPHCPTSIQGQFFLPAFLKLSKEEQQFVFDFILSSGNLKNMAAQMKLSYPTVRNLLDGMIAKLKEEDT